MKLTYAIFFCAASCVLASGTVFADDGFDFSGNASASDDSQSLESSDGGFSFGSDSTNSSSSFAQALSAVTIGGKLKLDARSYLDDPANNNKTDGENSPVKVVPDATLNVDYETDATEIELKLNFSEDSIKTYNEDVLEEFVARAYLGSVILEGGKEKLVWGKGDKLHVLDNFCATDYTDFIYPDYIDRRLAVPMFRAVFNAPSGSFRAEAVYAPMLVTDRFASDGYWKPAAVTTLTSRVKSIAHETLSGLSGETVTPAYVKQMSAAGSLSADDLYPETKTLKYGQYGARVTGTAGSFDWGLSYYYGRNKQPSVDSAKLASYVSDYIKNSGTSSLDTGIDYDRLQVFGLEGAKAFGGLNTRFEVAYNLTDDVSGNDKTIHNNSISWVPGFDMDLPVHNVNVNVQEIGTYILHGSSIEDNGSSDVDNDSKNCHSNNKLAVDISDTFLHENLKVDVMTIWGIERSDLIIIPKVTYTVKTGMDLIASGMYIWCDNEDSEFYAWRHNSFAQFGVKYVF